MRHIFLITTSGRSRLAARTRSAVTDHQAPAPSVAESLVCQHVADAAGMGVRLWRPWS
jgi:hypothetical protein